MNYHTPNDVEQEYFDRWIYQYGFSLDIILEAARRTFQKTGKASFKYMEGILNPWYQQGVRNLSDIAALDQAFLGTKVSSGMSTNRKGSYFARSTTPYYDYETYERLAKPAPEESED